MIDLLSIVIFMIVATLVSLFVTEPQTVNELLIGQWCMVLGIFLGIVVGNLFKKSK